MVDWAGVCGVASDDGNYDHEVHDPEGFTGDAKSRRVKKMSDISVNGVVQDYFIKPTKNGSYLHAVTVEGSKYSAFAQNDKARANPGDTVEFKAAQNDKGYFNINGPIKVLKRGAGHQQGSKQNYAPNEDARQASILRQSSMNYACNLVGALVNKGRFSELTEDEIATEVVRIANDIFYPYAKDGTKPE